VYARAARAVRQNAPLGLAFVLGSAFHACGHAGVALLAGHLTRLLAQGGSMVVVGSTTQLLRFPAAPLGLLLLSLLALGARAAGGALSSYALTRICSEMGAELRMDLLRGLLGVQEVRPPRHADHGVPLTTLPAAQLAALTLHVRTFEDAVRLGVFARLRALAQVVGLFIAMLMVSPTLTVLGAVVLAPFSLLVSNLRRRSRKALERSAQGTDALVMASQEAVLFADLWRVFGAERRVLSSARQLSEVLGRAEARLSLLASLSSGVNEVLGGLALLLLLFCTRAGLLSGEQVLPFMVLFFLAYRPLRDLAEARGCVDRAAHALVHVSPWTDGAVTTAVATVVAKAETPEPAPLCWEPATLLVQGLSIPSHGLRFPPLRLEPGDVTAVVGPSGCGKTSLLRALLGLEPGAEGRVTYGEVDLTRAGVGPSARPFAWVPQESGMLAGTVADNITLGHDVDPERLAACLALLGARIAPDATATGRAFSGGERQWTALARALLSDAPVLLLDEPTSALDPAASEAVVKVLKGLRGTRTVLVVTHRAEVAQAADRIVDLAALTERSAPLAAA
jgi:ABC-type multidrug transport system fused ATPase/permease subunit